MPAVFQISPQFCCAVRYRLAIKQRIVTNVSNSLNIFCGCGGFKWEEIIGEWRKLRNEELNDLYPSSNVDGVIKSRRRKWTGHVARMGERRSVYRILLGKREGDRPLGRPRIRWEDNIKMDLQKVGLGYGLDRAG
jgi:hypothetical protein